MIQSGGLLVKSYEFQSINQTHHGNYVLSWTFQIVNFSAALNTVESNLKRFWKNADQIGRRDWYRDEVRKLRRLKIVIETILWRIQVKFSVLPMITKHLL